MSCHNNNESLAFIGCGDSMDWWRSHTGRLLDTGDLIHVSINVLVLPQGDCLEESL